MKKIILISLLVFTFSTASAQISLNGYYMGSHYDGPQKVRTTIAGLNGILYIGTLQDHTIYEFVFASNPTTESKSIDFSKKIKDKYGVIFYDWPEQRTSTRMAVKGYKNGITYAIVYDFISGLKVGLIIEKDH